MHALETQIDTARTWSNGWQITLGGEIDRWDALNLDEYLLDAFDEGAVTIVVDLADVTYLAPFALDILLEAADRQHEVGGDLFLAARDDSPLGYTLRPLERRGAEHCRGLQPAFDRALDRRVAPAMRLVSALDAGDAQGSG